MVDSHPALRDLPEYVKSALLQEPGEWSQLPTNRRQRKRFKKKGGLILHLYGGEKEGYTLQSAMELQGMKGQILEVDIKRGQNHDMASQGSPAYKALLRTALDGALLGVIGGPNCRSRSVLRHYPGPPPLRSWEYEWGLPDLTEAQKKLCQDDDILMWRQIFLYLVADFVKRAKETGRGEKEEKMKPERPLFLLEQPGDPVDYMPDCVSFWRTKGWEALKAAANLNLLTVNQGDFTPWKEGAPVKLTGLGTNMKLRLPKERNPKAKGRGDGKRIDSSALARWVPGLCDAIASACATALQEEPEPEVKVKALSWDQHVQHGHVPFRRDCRVCQQQSAKSRPHRKIKHPLAGTLSLDTAGPYPVAPNDRDTAKCILVGTYTWLMPSDLPDPPDALPPYEDDEERGPILDEEEEEDPQQDQDEGAEEEQDGQMEEKEDEEQEDEEEGQDGEKEEAEEGERREDPKLVTYRMAIPMPSKDQKEILSAMWPYACHYVHERERRRMADKDMSDVPPFGHELLVKKRFWKTKELEGAHEKVRYLAPRPDAHGHLVLREDNTIAIAPYFIKKTSEPAPSLETWMAVVRAAEEEDPHVARRRIRGKMTMKAMKMEDEDEYEKMEKEQKRHQERVSKVILEESVIMLKDEMKVMDVVFEELKKVKSAVTQEEEQVLRTRIVSPRELLQEAPKWDEAIKKELHQLFEEKEALKKINEKEFQQLQQTWGKRLEVV